MNTWMLSLLILASLSLKVSAELTELPLTLVGAEVVDGQKVNKLIQSELKLPADKKTTLVVDVRKKMEFGEEHIQGAISLAYNENSKKTSGFDLSEDSFDVESLKSYPAKNLVFYCNGLQCWKSYKASAYAVKKKLGKKVLWYRAGMPDWRENKFPMSAGLE